MSRTRLGGTRVLFASSLIGVRVFFSKASEVIAERVLESPVAVSSRSEGCDPMPARASLVEAVVETSIAEGAVVDSAAGNAPKAIRNVSIRVDGLTDRPSNLHLAVFDSAKGFPDPGCSRETVVIPVDGDRLECSLELPGSVAVSIAVFQDLNGDGVLTKNGLGIPVEPYGFSNNVRGTFGPPSFGQAAIEVSEASSSIKIRVR